jgi:SWI/SNF-related matrix-associated actin-dependent regulator of chromatin subfamily A member 5
MERTQNSRDSPVTPKKRKTGEYQNLLQSFGSTSSATSVTKSRRESARVSTSTPSQETETSTERKTPSKRESRELSLSNHAMPDSTQSHPPPASLVVAFPTPQKPSPTEAAPAIASAHESSEDELIAPTSRKHTRRSLPADVEELKMESRKKDKVEHIRRSTRLRTSDILASDTLRDELAPSLAKKKAAPRLKPDTARQRLRDEIAVQSKAKANSFLIANKDYFVPLLPANNYVTKLASNEAHLSQPVVPYEELSKQPVG